MSDSRNTGDRNTGDWNTGDWNTGGRNTGHRNTGHWNTGGRNTGDRNTGDCNTGHWNTGGRNTGHRNTGHWNIVNKETGFFNSIQSDTVRVFNKDCDITEWDNAIKPNLLYFCTSEWIKSEDMTDDEKSKNPSHETTMGYLRRHDYKEAFQASYNCASEDDRLLLLELPNFDADVFFEISGIDVRNNDNKGKELKIKELKDQLDSIKKELDDLK
jgi:hypothetical protein